MVLKAILCCFTGVRLYIQERILHLFDLTHRSSVLQTQNAINYFHDGLKPAKLTWTAMYRKQHQKNTFFHVPSPSHITIFPLNPTILIFPLPHGYLVERCFCHSLQHLPFQMLQGLMAFWRQVQHYLQGDLYCSLLHLRQYGSKVDWNKLRPMILKRIRNRAKDYPVVRMIPIAQDVLKSREMLAEGISTLLKFIPVKSCKFCPEVYVGETGHQIKTCYGFKHIIKDQPHHWTEGKLNDILTPVESFHLQDMHQSIIKHDQRFDFHRVPAIVELCYQAGVEISDEVLYNCSPESPRSQGNTVKADVSSDEDIKLVAQVTLDAWETLRLGVQKLLLVYPVKVCKYCSEVHVGPSGHKARLCGVFKFERWKGSHMWKKAEVDDLVPPKMVWHRRPHDPPVLVDSGRGFYGHAPAVVELCMQAGARVPMKYFCMMKVHGLTAT